MSDSKSATVAIHDYRNGIASSNDITLQSLETYHEVIEKGNRVIPVATATPKERRVSLSFQRIKPSTENLHLLNPTV